MMTRSSFLGRSASLICLMATVSPLLQFKALYTDPQAPFPRQSPSCYACQYGQTPRVPSTNIVFQTSVLLPVSAAFVSCFGRRRSTGCHPGIRGCFTCHVCAIGVFLARCFRPMVGSFKGRLLKVCSGCLGHRRGRGRLGGCPGDVEMEQTDEQHRIWLV